MRGTQLGGHHVEIQTIQRAGRAGDDVGGDAGIDRRGHQPGMPERPRVIMRTFYVIETESSAERDPVLVSERCEPFCPRYAAMSSALITHGAPRHSWRPSMMRRRIMLSAVMSLTTML